MQSCVILQITDSAFPAGGFAHSGGLEAAAQAGEADGGSLAELLRSFLIAQSHGMVTFVLQAHRPGVDVAAIHARCDAYLTNHVARAASARQGAALVASAAAIFSSAGLAELREALGGAPRSPGARPCHLAPAFGAVAARLGIPAVETVRAYLFVAARDLVLAAVRLNLVGPLAGHAALHALAPEIDTVAAAAAAGAPAGAIQTAPLLDMAQMMHPRLYSRLFQS